MNEDKYQLAIIREVGYGMRDCSRPVLHFTVYTDECSAALQVFSQPRADEIITEAGASDVRNLEGRACWVDTSDRGLIKFVKVAKI